MVTPSRYCHNCGLGLLFNRCPLLNGITRFRLENHDCFHSIHNNKVLVEAGYNDAALKKIPLTYLYGTIQVNAEICLWLLWYSLEAEEQSRCDDYQDTRKVKYSRLFGHHNSAITAEFISTGINFPSSYRPRHVCWGAYSAYFVLLLFFRQLCRAGRICRHRDVGTIWRAMDHRAIVREFPRDLIVNCLLVGRRNQSERWRTLACNLLINYRPAFRCDATSIFFCGHFVNRRRMNNGRVEIACYARAWTCHLASGFLFLHFPSRGQLDARWVLFAAPTGGTTQNSKSL